jgi:excisionase family DNA binding protein
MIPRAQGYIFQLRREDRGPLGIGWLLADEGIVQEERVSPTFTIPAFQGDESVGDYICVGRVRHELAYLAMYEENERIHFRYKSTIVRFKINRHRDQYLGESSDILAQYGCTPETEFLELTPLNLAEMDKLYLEAGVVFVGITQHFGPHVPEQAIKWTSAAFVGATNMRREVAASSSSATSLSHGNRLLTIREVAAYLGVHQGTVRRLVARGDLKAIKGGHRVLRLNEADVRKFMDGLGFKRAKDNPPKHG